MHSPEEAEAAARGGGLDYLDLRDRVQHLVEAGRPTAGVGPLGAGCARVALPVLAIGGMVPERLGLIAESGADGFAAIGLFAECALDALPSVITTRPMRLQLKGVP